MSTQTNDDWDAADSGSVPPSQVELKQPPAKADKPPQAKAKAKAVAAVQAKPKTLAEALAAVRAVEAIAPKNKAERLDKESRLAAAKKDAWNIQQGLPTITMDANALSGQFRRQAPSLKSTRLEMKARQDPDVRALLNEQSKQKK